MRQSLFNEIIKHQRPLVQCNDSKIKRRIYILENSAHFSYPDFILPTTLTNCSYFTFAIISSKRYSIILAELGNYTTLREE